MTGVSRWVVRAAVTGLVAITVASCGDDQVSAAGIWALRTVNGGDLPAVLSDDGTVEVSIRRALIFIETEGCIIDATYITRTNAIPREEDVGLVCEWEQSGSSVALGWSGGGGLTGSVDEQFLRLTDDDGHEYVYERL